MSQIDGKGLLVIISAPSGAGKDAVLERLVKALGDAVVYVTATSRKPRANEKHGVHYYFYEPDKFRAEIEAGNFLEWSMVHGDFKGVRRDALGDTLRGHKIVIVKPEPQGMRKIKAPSRSTQNHWLIRVSRRACGIGMALLNWSITSDFQASTCSLLTLWRSRIWG